MVQTILTSSIITKEALRILHNKLSFISRINRQYDDKFAVTGAKIGNTLNVRKPARYVIRNGAPLNPQDHIETYQPLSLTTQKGVDVNFTSAELTMQLDDFSERVLEPAMAVLASNIEADALTMFKSVYNQVGTAGTTPSALSTFLDAQGYMNRSLAPLDGNRTMLINSKAVSATIDALKGLFHSSSAIEEQYKEGMMGRTVGFDWYSNELVPRLTVGTRVVADAIAMNGATADGATTISINGMASTATGTIKKGEVFTIAGVHAVHPETKQAYSDLQQFVVTADATAVANAIASLAISPAIIASGPFQNVDAVPLTGALLTFQSGLASTIHTQNLAFHRDAFCFATADLEMPQGVHFAAREMYDGISMRIVRAYDINADKIPCRIDILYGYTELYPQLACRIIGE